MQDLETIIIHHPFWQNLHQRYSHFLGECADFPTLRTSAADLSARAARRINFYLIERGRVALETPFIPGKGVIIIQTLEAGEALGWSWLFPPFVWHFGARAIEPTDLIVFDAEFLASKGKRRP